MLVLYCCFFCKKLATNNCPRCGCYNALGGEEHFKDCLVHQICNVKGSICNESFNQGNGKMISAVESNKDCWEGIKKEIVL